MFINKSSREPFTLFTSSIFNKLHNLRVHMNWNVRLTNATFTKTFYDIFLYFLGAINLWRPTRQGFYLHFNIDHIFRTCHTRRISLILQQFLPHLSKESDNSKESKAIALYRPHQPPQKHSHTRRNSRNFPSILIAILQRQKKARYRRASASPAALPDFRNIMSRGGSAWAASVKKTPTTYAAATLSRKPIPLSRVWFRLLFLCGSRFKVQPLLRLVESAFAYKCAL